MRLSLACLLFFLVVGVQAAVAQTNGEGAAPPERLTDDARARELYYRGDRLYGEGSYDEATRAFEESYALSARPELLFNMANALERAGRYEEALQALNRFLPDAPENLQHAVRKRIEALEARVEQEPEVTQGSQAREPAKPAAREVPPRSSRAFVEPPARAGSAWPYVLMGVSALGFAGGTYFALAAGKEHDRAAQGCHSGLCSQAASGALDREARDALLADVGFAVGIAGLAVGLVLMFAGEHESADQVRGVAQREGGGVLWHASF